MKLAFNQKRTGSCLLAVMLAGLIACSSPTERAQGFYEKGKVFLQQGDLVKAGLEFRNALQIKHNMAPAWLGLAEVAERQGDWEQLYRSLNRVIELDQKNIDAHLKLGRLLVAAGQLDKALAISDTVKALDPERPEVMAFRASVLFKLDDRKAAVALAKTVLEKDPKNIDALVVLASERMAAGDAAKAVEYLDVGIEADEKNIALQLIKVRALLELGKPDAVEEILRRLIVLNPDAPSFKYSLARFYLAHGKKDKAEAEFRAVVAANPKDVNAKIEVVRFLASVRGSKAATAELQALLSADPGNTELLFALAGLHQAEGDREAADDVLRKIMAKAGDTQDGLRAKGLLAGSLLAGKDKTGAKALVKDILAKDARNEQALILRAEMEIDEGQIEDAIADLRTILRDAPSSPRALLLLGKAHELTGARDLADDIYSRAFQASKLAGPYGVTYADFLIKVGKAKQAEAILKDVLRTTPGYVPAIRILAQVYLMTGNIAGAQSMVEEARRLKGQGVLADQIQGGVYAARKNFDDSISSFKRAYEASPSDVQPMLALVRSYLRAGKTREALSFVDSVVQASPDNNEARLLQGQLEALSGSKEKAASIFRKIIETDPKNAEGYLHLANLMLYDKRLADADKAVSEGLAAIPNDFALRATKAAILVYQGKFDEAIALYEGLLKERPGADVVVNNLASLLSENRQDKESLKRAYELASRLKDSDLPMFKDTVGWASYKVGKYQEAVPFLEAAVNQRPDMALLRYHAGMNQLALGNKDAARKELQKSLELAQNQPFSRKEEATKALQGL